MSARTLVWASIAGGLTTAWAARLAGEPPLVVGAALWLGAVLVPLVGILAAAALGAHQRGMARVRAAERRQAWAAPRVLYGKPGAGVPLTDLQPGPHPSWSTLAGRDAGTCSHGVPWSGTCYSCRVRI